MKKKNVPSFPKKKIRKFVIIDDSKTQNAGPKISAPSSVAKRSVPTRQKLEIQSTEIQEIQSTEIQSAEIQSTDRGIILPINDDSNFKLDLDDSRQESILQMNKDEYIESFDNYYDRWIGKISESNDPLTQFGIALNFFSNKDIVPPQQPENGYATAIAKMQQYLLYLMEHEDDMTFTEDELKSFSKKIDQMIIMIYQYDQAYRIIMKNQDVLYGVNNDIEGGLDNDKWRLSPSMIEFLRPENSSPKYNDKQKLHIRLLKQLSIRGYRKYGDYCYKEKKTPNGKPTHAWEQCCKIEQFVKDRCNRLINPENWDILTKQSKSGVEDMIEKLVKLDDPEFPPIEKDRHKFSFKNGIFVTKLKAKDKHGKPKTVSKFYPYGGDDILKVNNRLASAKYHDIEFHDYIVQDGIKDWYNIPTPTFQKVLDHQFKQYPQDEYQDICKWFYVMFGRMLFNPGDLDNWQVMMYILGEPGTGKSTLFKDVLQKIYDQLEIGILDNNMERQFGLEPLLDHELYMIIGEELDEHFKLERTTFLKMVSNEDIMAARKSKTAVKVRFKSHIGCCGNKMIGYQDNKGELKRRVVPFIYDNKVLPSHSDPDMHNKLRLELGAIIQKIVCAYLEYSQRYGKSNIWHILPKYFTKTSQRLAERTNPRRAFLESNDIVYGPDLYITENELRTKYMEFCKERTFARQKFEFESWKSDFQDISYEKGIDIRIEMKTDKIYPRQGGMMVHGENFVIGLDIKYDDFLVNNNDESE